MHKKFILQYTVKPWKGEQKIRASRDKSSEIFNRLRMKGLSFICWNKRSYQGICWNKWVSFEKMAKFLTVTNKGAHLILVGKFGQFLFKNFTTTGWEFSELPPWVTFGCGFLFFFSSCWNVGENLRGKKDENLLGLCQYLKQVGKVKVITWALVSES